jgi:cytochrome c biogenesis protein ResB
VKRLWATAVSLRTSAVLLSVLSVFLLLNVMLPQRAHDPEAYVAAMRSSAAARFLLGTLELGELPTSRLFAAFVALLFANLAAVLFDRLGTTLRRVRFAPPAAAQLEKLLASADAVEVDAPGLSPDAVRATLAAIGYRTAGLADGGVWGVKHRFALLGFPVFHASFFLLAGGALQLYLTRDVTTLVASEGQVVSTAEGSVVRRAPSGAPPPILLAVDRVEVKLEDGKPLDLGARIAVQGQGGTRPSHINHPATWGDLTVLVDRAGIAPVLWLVDDRGYTVDRVVVPTASGAGLPTRAGLAGGALTAVVKPIPVGATFPERAALATVPVELRIESDAGKLFEGRLAPGGSLRIGDRELRLQEVRYWVGMRVVRERGGPWLVAGFVLAVAGILWRMVWVRRELAVARVGDRLRISARAEFYASGGRDEAVAVAALLTAEAVRGNAA